ncbi:MAG: ATP-binding protein [Thermoplasmatota archaeon]
MYVERDISDHFDKIKEIYNTIAVVGPRQAGKTTFLKNRKGKQISYLLFDDPDIRSLFERDVKAFQERYLKGNRYSILDEVQICDDAGANLKYLNDEGNRMWVTSSSELLLGKEVLSYLVGRVSILRLFPFSIMEYIRARQYDQKDRRQVSRSIRDLTGYGGYPKVVLEEDRRMKQVILKDLYETMVIRDIAKVFGIGDIGALERAVLYLANMYTGQFSIDSMSRDLAISFKTLRSYISAMEKSYLISMVPPYFTNPNKELIKQPKIYFFDNGMRNVISGNVGMDIDGRSFENLVFTELVKMGYRPKYWRKKTGQEVDFVVQMADEMVPIEVKLKTPGYRIESGLRSYIRMYSPRRAIVVIAEGEGSEVEVEDTVVEFIDIIKFRRAFNFLI